MIHAHTSQHFLQTTTRYVGSNPRWSVGRLVPGTAHILRYLSTDMKNGFLNTHTNTHARSRARARTHTHTHVHTHTHTRMQARAHTKNYPAPILLNRNITVCTPAPNTISPVGRNGSGDVTHISSDMATYCHNSLFITLQYPSCPPAD